MMLSLQWFASICRLPQEDVVELLIIALVAFLALALASATMWKPRNRGQ